MSVELVDASNGADEGQDTAGEQKQPPVAAPEPQVDPREIAREILDEFVKERGYSQPARSNDKEQPSATEREVRRLLAAGYTSDQVRDLLGLFNAQKQDTALQNEALSYEQAWKNFNKTCWDMAEQALEEFAAAVPALKKENIRQAMLIDLNDVLSEDKEFAAEVKKIGKGVLPSKDVLRKAAVKVVDRFCEENGITKKQAPQVDFSSSKPSPSATKADPMASLSAEAKKLYRSAVSHLGHERALQRAKQYDKAS